MSHFTVQVRLTAARLAKHGGDVESALAEIMAPYNEQPDDDERKYLSFVDEEDKELEEYKTGSVEMIQLPKGELVYPWDKRFGGDDPPTCLPRVQLAHATKHATFETFMKEWHGSDGRDPDKGRYGHWRNEQGYWDWFSIGGRWTGFYPIKTSAIPQLGTSGAFDNQPPAHRCSDIVRVSDIDMDHVASETRRKAEKFWKEWTDFLAGKKFGAFDGPRSWAMTIGLLRVEQGPAEPTATTKVIPWLGTVDDEDERRTWNDVALLMTEQEFLAEYMDAFCPITTFAALDDDGWHQPGKMGWFGCDHSEADAKRNFQKEFVQKFIRNVPNDDLLVVVDCHV